MKRATSLTLCCVSLFLGALGGSLLSQWTVGTSAQADQYQQKVSLVKDQELNPDGISLVQSGRHLAKVAAATSPSVVHILSQTQTAKAGLIEETGSGILVAGDEVSGVYVVTNRHVIYGSKPDSISIHLFDGRVVHPKRIWEDEATDVAVMKVAISDVQLARWGDSDKVEIGHLVLAMGSPFGLSQSVTMGIISAKGRRSLELSRDEHGQEAVINQNFLQTDAAINPGNSGGPLIDVYGRVIGINTAIASNSGGNEGIGFSIPSNLVRRVANELLENNKVRRAFLGVRLDDNFELNEARKLKLDRVRGARVDEVFPNTPASRANLRVNDVILTFDGVDVLDENHLINLVSLASIDKDVRIVILRDGTKVTLNVVLGDRDALND